MNECPRDFMAYLKWRVSDFVASPRLKRRNVAHITYGEGSNPYDYDVRIPTTEAIEHHMRGFGNTYPIFESEAAKIEELQDTLNKARLELNSLCAKILLRPEWRFDHKAGKWGPRQTRTTE